MIPDKIPFKNYKNIRIFFFEIFNSWDSNFTDDDAEKILKLAVRNASKRKLMKGLRQSSKRTCKSNNHSEELNYIASNNSEELQVGDEDNDNKKEELEPASNGDNNKQKMSDESMDLC